MPIGFRFIAKFHAYCAAVASVISPVRAATAICLSVIVPSDAASARLSAVTAAVCVVSKAVTVDIIEYDLNAAYTEVITPNSTSELSASKSTALDKGGKTTFATFVKALPKLTTIFFTLSIAFLRPPFSNDFLIVFTVSLTGA